MRIVCGSKALNKFQTFEGSQYFPPDLREQFTYKISKERRITIASVMGLDNCLLSHHLPINVLIGRAEGLYFLMKEIFKSIC